MSLAISPTKRCYGMKKDSPDKRDKMYAKLSSPVALPRIADLRPWVGSIKDQGSEGSCTGHAGSSDVEWQCRKYRNEQPVLSPAFLYSQELINEGTFPNDNGAMPRSICQVLNKFGVCEESVDPYKPGSIVTPSAPQIENAKKYQLGGYHRMTSLDQVLSCLGDPTPWPVLLSFNVYASFESEAVAKTGLMPIPNPAYEVLMGGHEVLVVGYDQDKQVLIIQNSWGRAWGDQGFFYMPFPLVQNPNMVTDLWIIHFGHWA